MSEKEEGLKKYFDIAETFNRVGKLKAAFGQYRVKDMTRENFRELLRQVLKVMPQDLPSQRIFDSLMHLYGRPLTDQIVNDTAWRLSGNTEILRQGEVITSNIALERSGWCAVQVLSCRPFTRNPRSKTSRVRGCIYKCAVLTGHAAGLSVEKFLTLRHVKYFAQELGFTPPFKNRPFKDEHEFFGMRFGALFVSGLAADGKPVFNEMCVSPSMVTWNKKLINNRLRQGHVCPMGLTAEQLPCYRCWRGANSCVAAIRPKDLEQDLCEYCGKHEALFEPDSAGYTLGMCIDCQRHQDTTGLELVKRTHINANPVRSA